MDLKDFLCDIEISVNEESIFFKDTEEKGKSWLQSMKSWLWAPIATNSETLKQRQADIAQRQKWAEDDRKAREKRKNELKKAQHNARMKAEGLRREMRNKQLDALNKEKVDYWNSIADDLEKRKSNLKSSIFPMSEEAIKAASAYISSQIDGVESEDVSEEQTDLLYMSVLYFEFDDNGNIKKDENGQPIVRKDSNGNTIKYDSDDTVKTRLEEVLTAAPYGMSKEEIQNKINDLNQRCNLKNISQSDFEQIGFVMNTNEEEINNTQNTIMRLKTAPGLKEIMSNDSPEAERQANFDKDYKDLEGKDLDNYDIEISDGSNSGDGTAGTVWIKVKGSDGSEQRVKIDDNNKDQVPYKAILKKAGITITKIGDGDTAVYSCMKAADYNIDSETNEVTPKDTTKDKVKDKQTAVKQAYDDYKAEYKNAKSRIKKDQQNQLDKLKQSKGEIDEAWNNLKNTLPEGTRELLERKIKALQNNINDLTNGGSINGESLSMEDIIKSVKELQDELDKAYEDQEKEKEAIRKGSANFVANVELVTSLHKAPNALSDSQLEQELNDYQVETELDTELKDKDIDDNKNLSEEEKANCKKVIKAREQLKKELKTVEKGSEEYTAIVAKINACDHELYRVAGAQNGEALVTFDKANNEYIIRKGNGEEQRIKKPKKGETIPKDIKDALLDEKRRRAIRNKAKSAQTRTDSEVLIDGDKVYVRAGGDKDEQNEYSVISGTEVVNIDKEDWNEAEGYDIEDASILDIVSSDDFDKGELKANLSDTIFNKLKGDDGNIDPAKYDDLTSEEKKEFNKAVKRVAMDLGEDDTTDEETKNNLKDLKPEDLKGLPSEILDDLKDDNENIDPAKYDNLTPDQKRKVKRAIPDEEARAGEDLVKKAKVDPRKVWKQRTIKAGPKKGKKTKSFYNKKGESISRKEYNEKIKKYQDYIKRHPNDTGGSTPQTDNSSLFIDMSLVKFLLEASKDKKESDSEETESSSGSGHDTNGNDEEPKKEKEDKENKDDKKENNNIEPKPIEGTELFKIGNSVVFTTSYKEITKKVLQYLRYTAKSLDYVKMLNIENEQKINIRNLPKEVVKFLKEKLDGMDMNLIDTFYFIKDHKTITIFCGLSQDTKFMTNIKRYIENVDKKAMKQAFEIL